MSPRAATRERAEAEYDHGAARFAARVRSRRRRRWAMVVAGLLVLAGAVWVVLFSQWLSVRSIEIDGLDRVPAASVHLAVDGELGRAMVLVDPDAVARRVVTVPLVHDVLVERRWPSTLLVHVNERVPVAAVPARSGGLRLVDADGVEVDRATKATLPANLPVLDVDVDPSKAATLRAALAVLSSLRPPLAPTVSTVGADTPDGVWLTLDDGTRVVWGDASEPDHKAQVVQAVLTTQKGGRGVVVDVSSPDAPAVTKR